MARSKKAGSKRGGRLLFLIPIAALVSVAVFYALSAGLFPSPPAAQDFTVQLEIRVSNQTNTAGQDIVPSYIGVAGGTWKIHTYDSLGLDSRYPVYVEGPPSNYSGYVLIHVRSKIVHQFYLGDLFNLWGYPLSQNITLTYPSGPYGGTSGYYWWMCVVPAPHQPARPGQWSLEPLTPGKFVRLQYANIGCMPGQS